MFLTGGLGRLAVVVVACAAAAACAVQLVAPYNSELAQRASSMQAEVAAWDLTMRGGAGTIADDPRNSEVVAIINKWHGEADAMLTLAVSNDPGKVNCSEAAKAVFAAIDSRLPADLRAAATAGNANAGAGPLGCEVELVASVETGIDDIQKGLKYCRLDWLDDAYFAGLTQNRAAAAKSPAAPTPAKQDALTRSCFAEFKVAPGAPANAAGAQHGRAVSALLTTLQAIVYVENRKKAAVASK